MFDVLVYVCIDIMIYHRLARGGEVGVNAQSAGVDVGQDVLKILKAVEVKLLYI